MSVSCFHMDQIDHAVCRPLELLQLVIRSEACEIEKSLKHCRNVVDGYYFPMLCALINSSLSLIKHQSQGIQSCVGELVFNVC